MGTYAVGSMVVFVDGRPRPAEYRRFRIKGVAGQDDYAMLQEVLRRRFRRARGEGAQEGAPGRHAPANVPDGPLLGSKAGQRGTGSEPSGPAAAELEKEGWAALPELLIVDGGKGQLNAALDVLRDLGLGQVPAAGLAKRQ